VLLNLADHTLASISRQYSGARVRGSGAVGLENETLQGSSGVRVYRSEQATELLGCL